MAFKKKFCDAFFFYKIFEANWFKNLNSAISREIIIYTISDYQSYKSFSAAAHNTS